MKQKDNLSVWGATAEPPAARAVLEGREEADVVIIGAGFSGLSTALHLGDHKLRAVVLEAHEPGFGASGASGGQIHTSLRHFPSALTAAYGEQFGSKAHAFGASAAAATFAIIERHGIRCDARQSGVIQAADTLVALAETKRRAEYWARQGVAARALDRAEIEALTGSAAYLGGWLDERGGVLQPLSYVQGLARAALAAGQKIYTHSPARSIERCGQDWLVRTSHGSVSARHLLIATNALTDDLWPRLRRSILPVWSFQIATRPLTLAERVQILPGGQAVSDTRRIVRYFRLDPAGRLVIGGRGSASGPSAANAFAIQCLSLRRLYPQLADARIEYRWGGQVAVLPDRLPRIFSLGPSALATFGCNGKGVAWCSALGAALAASFAEGTTTMLPIPVAPITTIPLHGLRRMYVGAANAFFRLRDALDRPLSASA